MPLTDEQRMAILDEIIELSMPLIRQPYQFTVGEYHKRLDGKVKTRSAAYHKLDTLAAKGKLKKTVAIVNGSRCNVYWRPEDEPQGSHD